MNSIQIRMASIPAMTDTGIDKVSALEKKALTMPQVNMPIHQTLHDGVYTRTATLPGGVMITGALIKIPTTIIVSGDVTAFIGDETIRLTGYHVITASAGRKQLFIAHSLTYLTMMFASGSASTEDAEKEFTDEFDMLTTNRGVKCLE